jgi:hypothetical protein
MGTSTGSTTLTQLGSCTIPAGLLGTGDRIELQFQYAHTGSAAGVSGQIQWGGTTVFSRSSVASETAVVGRIALGIDSGTQSWDAQSWGNSLTLANTVGSAGEDTTQNLTISFRGQMLAVTGDSVLLSNFTVIRYPAQTNP